MTKTFFNRTTGNAAVFEDDANLADWPEFQEFPLSTSVTYGEVIIIRRNALQVSDWMVATDRTATQEQLDYRQALRDIPSQVAFTEERYDVVEWPEKPVDPGHG